MSKDVRNFLIGATLFFAAGPLFRAATNAFVAGSTGSAAFFYNAGRALRFIGINTMIDAGLNALAPKPRVAPVARESLVTSGVGAALLGYGECRVSGQMVWYGGTPDQRQVDYVIAHSLASPCGVDSIGDVIVNGVTIPDADIDGNGDITDGQFQGVLSIQRQVGRDSDTTWTALDNSYLEWTSDHRGRGVAKTWLRVTHSGNEKEFAEAFGGGLVTSAFVIGKWQKVYDPRKDGSRIGTGTHRIDDPDTWEWSSNPALIARDYLAQPKRRKPGEYYKPPAYWTDERLTYVAAAANVCDELVESPAGNIKRFEFHGFLDLSRPPRENLRAILESMVGTWDAASGRLFAAAYESPVASIDDTWLRGESRWIPYEPRARRFNTWRGKYYSSAGGWEEVQTEELVDAAAVSADGATILKEPELVGTRDEYHGQIIGTIHLRRAQLGGTLFLPCNWKALDVRYWDTVTVTLPEHGLDGEVMKIVKWTLDSDNGPSLVLIRESEDIYPMVLGDFTARTITGPGGKVVLQPPAPDQPTHRVNAGVIELNTAASLPSAWDFTVWERAPDAGGSPGTWGEIGEVRGTRFTDAPAAGTYHYRVRVRSKSYDYSGYSDPAGPIVFQPAEEGADVTPNWGALPTQPGWSYDGDGAQAASDVAAFRTIGFIQENGGVGIGYPGGPHIDDAPFVNPVTGRLRVNQTVDGSSAFPVDTGDSVRIFTDAGEMSERNDAPWATHVAGRPVELTDGRVDLGIEVGGIVRQNVPLDHAAANLVALSTASGRLRVNQTVDGSSAFPVDTEDAVAVLSDGATVTAGAADGAAVRPRAEAGLEGDGIVKVGRVNSLSLQSRLIDRNHVNFSKLDNVLLNGDSEYSVLSSNDHNTYQAPQGAFSTLTNQGRSGGDAIGYSLPASTDLTGSAVITWNGNTSNRIRVRAGDRCYAEGWIRYYSTFAPQNGKCWFTISYFNADGSFNSASINEFNNSTITASYVKKTISGIVPAGCTEVVVEAYVLSDTNNTTGAQWVWSWDDVVLVVQESGARLTAQVGSSATPALQNTNVITSTHTGSNFHTINILPGFKQVGDIQASWGNGSAGSGVSGGLIIYPYAVFGNGLLNPPTSFSWSSSPYFTTAGDMRVPLGKHTVPNNADGTGNTSGQSEP